MSYWYPSSTISSSDSPQTGQQLLSFLCPAFGRRVCVPVFRHSYLFRETLTSAGRTCLELTLVQPICLLSCTHRMFQAGPLCTCGYPHSESTRCFSPYSFYPCVHILGIYYSEKVWNSSSIIIDVDSFLNSAVVSYTRWSLPSLALIIFTSFILELI